MGSGSFSRQLTETLRGLDSRGVHRRQRTSEFLTTTECRIDGRVCTSFASNDYLGLSRHPDVLNAFAAAAQLQAGAGSSPLIAGRTPSQQQLERALAEFEQVEAITLFPSGYAANFGTLNALTGERDVVFCDRENHASLIDGSRACVAEFCPFSGRRLDRLDRLLRQRRHRFGQAFVVTDSVFSMDGSLADLATLSELCDRHDAILIIDEAHGTGVFGAAGRGVAELQQVEHQIDVRIGTLSKAIASLGGFVAGSKDLCDVIWNLGRSQFFSTALPPAVCAAAAAALRIVATEPTRRELLLRRSEFARQRLREAGLPVMNAPENSPIIGVLIGDDSQAARIGQKLLEAGQFIPAVRTPTVRKGTARLRLSLCCDHTESQIQSAVCHLREVWESETG